MRDLLKMVVMVVCFQGGDSRWQRSPPGQKPGDLFSGNSSTDQDPRPKEPPAEATAGEPEPPRRSAVPVPVRLRRFTSDSHCALRSVQLQVQDLGLGFRSDETVLFKYCSGSCPDAGSNYELALGNLLLSGVVRRAAPEEAWPHGRCCRPTGLEDAAFLDNLQRWHSLEKLSAVGCACAG